MPTEIRITPLLTTKCEHCGDGMAKWDMLIGNPFGPYGKIYLRVCEPCFREATETFGLCSSDEAFRRAAANWRVRAIAEAI